MILQPTQEKNLITLVDQTSKMKTLLLYNHYDQKDIDWGHKPIRVDDALLIIY